MTTARILFLAVLLLVQGCGEGGTGGNPTGSVPPDFAPFQGRWRLSMPKTIARWQADGVEASEISQVQNMAALFPFHPDMSIKGSRAILMGRVEGSYDFFALHAHPKWLCGKAWHHEDRHDSGDMDKYYVRLELRGGDLHLSIRAHDDAADPSDPDVTTMPLTAGSAANCPADATTDPPWSPWRTYVFEPG